MRITVIRPGPTQSVEDVARGWSQAFADLGHDVHEFAMGERLDFFSQALVEIDGEPKTAFTEEQAGEMALDGVLAHAYKSWPEMFFIVSGFYTPPRILEILKARGHRLVLLCTESPYEEGRQLDLCAPGYFDAILLNDPTHIEFYRDMSPVVAYQPHCYRPDFHCPGDPVPEWQGDVAWVGSAYPSRIAFMEQVDFTGLTVRLAGNWTKLDETSPLNAHVLDYRDDRDDCLNNEDTVRLYRSVKATFNPYRKEAEAPDRVEGWALGPREIEATMTGTLCLREPRGEGDDILPMLPTFADAEELGDQLRWWCSHDDEREEAVLKAQVALADRTFDNAAASLLTRLEAVPASR